jgi:hypothetical protein
VIAIQLSSYEFRTYRRGNGGISLRHRSYLIVNTNAGFSLSSYLTKMAARLTLPDSTVIDIENIRFTVGVEFEDDGKAMVHSFWLWDAFPRKKIKPGVECLRIEYEITLVEGHPEQGVHEHPMIVKPLQYGRAE